jgi:2-phospho-L-lactate/phosphoenolpyruvate guanylyltransferase
MPQGSSVSPARSRPDQVVVVPIKRFADAKGRLAPHLDASQRIELARSMARHVLASVASERVAVVCDDPEVNSLAAEFGAEVIEDVGGGLNRALTHAIELLRSRGVTRATIVHADLPQATLLGTLLDRVRLGSDDALLLPDRHGDGTNVMSIPLSGEFELFYGSASFSHHLNEARRRGLRIMVVIDAGFAHDVDVPTDLA